MSPDATAEVDIAVVVPCHNEEAAIAKVVTDVRHAMPSARIYVYDNASTDATAQVAAGAGALVRHESRKGKGNVIRRAFADIDADVFVIIDGDDTYDATAAPQMVRRLLSGPYDQVLGVRTPNGSLATAYRPGHQRGNIVLNKLVGVIFGTNVADMLSGYRVLSRRFVKSFPAVSREFEIETELTVHSLALRIPHTSENVGFRDRADGTESKLRTYRDGSKILRLILALARHERPVAFYSLLGSVAFILATVLATPVVLAYFETGKVLRFPTLFVALTLGITALLSMTAGLILDGIRKQRHELCRLLYLSYDPPA